MEKLIENFTLQLKEAMDIGEQARLTESSRGFKNIVIAGMGGSGIGGTIVSELVLNESHIPIHISKGYFLPKFVDEGTLVIVSSYSGNTEETISTLNEALEKGAKVVAIASGGKIINIAKEKGLDYIEIPNTVIAEGVSSPRAAIGYSIVQLFYILNFFNIIDSSFKEELKKSIELLETERENIKKEAGKVATKLLNKFPIIYAPEGYSGVAVRFKQQLNENAKMLGYYNVIPEMNHNELLGWEGGESNTAVIIFRNQDDYAKIKSRIEFSKETIEKHTSTVIDIYSKGSSPIEKSMYLIHLGDYISIYLANLRKVDPNKLDVIEDLKKSLASS